MHAGDAAEEDAKVFGRLIEHILRRLHHAQHGRGRQHAHHGQQHAGGKRQQNGGVYGLTELFKVFRAEVLGDDHGGAGGQADEHAHQRVDDRTGTADGGQRLFPHVVSDYDGVDGIVKLLKKIADQQRDGKADQKPRDTAGGHIRILAAEHRGQGGSLLNAQCTTTICSDAEKVNRPRKPQPVELRLSCSTSALRSDSGYTPPHPAAPDPAQRPAPHAAYPGRA